MLVLFDIDGVLFDREQAEDCGVQHILHRYIDKYKCEDYDRINSIWRRVNDRLWSVCGIDHNPEEVLRLRWKELFLAIGQECSDEVIEEITDDYTHHYARENYIDKGVRDTVDLLIENGIRVGIVTNGIKRIQLLKLKIARLLPKLSVVITQDEAGCRKPDQNIFVAALSATDCKVQESIYIGNSFSEDMVPAYELGMHAIWYDCNKKYTINSPKAELISRLDIAPNVEVLRNLLRYKYALPL